METLALRDGDILPTQEVLETALGSSYPAFEELNALLIAMEIRPEWNYYRDGKAWLCKMMFKKKNMGWLHVYDGFFRVSFFFMERHLSAIADLNISDHIKEDFYEMKPVGKLLPMSIVVGDKEKLEDVLTVLRFKRSLK
ncbi:DUF3788 family protein [Bacteroides nordii]|uniref:DUF3788 family protein n=1 Tax=Bacteroides nordii TaxID=291645 RepID=UPI00203F48E6|nr:DUF3788 family protein [Bacteroides nordii]GFZ41915.1 hypothetical protein BANORC5_39500 [Bacteroides nordii]